MGKGNRDASFDLMLLKARALAGKGNPKALDILYALLDRSPDCLEIWQMIGRVCFENSLFEGAAEAWMVTYLSTDSLESLKYLICSLLYTDTFSLLFGEWEIQRHAGSGTVKLVVEMVLAKREYFSLDRLIVSSGIYQSRERDFSTEEVGAARAAAALSCRALDRHGISSADCRAEEGAAPDLKSAAPQPVSSDQFNVLYQGAIQLLEDGSTTASLDTLLDLYRQPTHDDLLRYLVKSEKWEILFYLGRASVDHRIYYEHVAVAIRNAKIHTFHAAISSPVHLSLLEELIGIL